ncbi:MAG TPA: hypothetical protein VGY56_19745 [Verrucomicrobiae bacterium]|nr:hypothetical protein [Verrucomicrobiae bacterium]
MKTITLGTLIREPVKVKRLTRAGQSITVIDHGNPLCVIRPAEEKEAAGTREARLHPGGATHFLYRQVNR